MPWLLWVDRLLLFYYGVLCLVYLLLFIAALLSSLRHQVWVRTLPLRRLAASPLAPSVAVLVPAHNEALGIVASVQSLLALDYPRFEVIVINDGSNDDTLARLKQAFGLVRLDFFYQPQIPTAPVRDVYVSPEHHRLLVCDKQQGGKSDALNTGLNLCHSAYFCTVDADAVLNRDGLLRVMLPVFNDRGVVASGGVVRPANGCRFRAGQVEEVRLPSHPLEILQSIEYLRAFLWGRVGWSALKGLMIISGAFGVFRREVAIEVGGFRTDTVGEDMDLLVRLHRRLRDRREPYSVTFVPDPICWTEIPSNLAGLARQRRRWQRGLGEALWYSRGMLLRPRYGRLGWLAFPYQLIYEFYGPLVETVGLVAVVVSAFLGVLDRQYFLNLFLLAYLYGTFLSVAAVLLEELGYHRYRRTRELAILFGFALLEHFPYRQLVNLSRLLGILDFVRREHGWGKARRRGFEEAKPNETPAEATVLAPRAKRPEKIL
ncbi:glycosyltransferase family 2 protein [Acidobacteriia bacterium AH_259_A11_L15]|nr:glycosyltransferase family 2 protein [Acidobacteriia bacterium AH_259_A11_L15]